MPAKKTSSSNSSNFRLYRSEKNRVLGGVCGGIGELFDIDPSIIRIIFVLMFAFGGSGVFIYLLLWLVIPSEGQGTASRESIHKGIDEMRGQVHSFAQKFRASSNPAYTRPHLGWIIILLGLVFLFSNFGFSFNLDKFWPVVLIILGFYLITRA